MTKAEIRAQIAEQKKVLGVHALEKMSAAVFQKLQEFAPFCTARTVGAYMPFADEVNIAPLFQTPSKTFYIPAFDEASGSYRMARLTAKLKKGRFGIPEPEGPVFATGDELDLILVPGVAFDLAGRRIGRGGGFYDRLLPQYRAIYAGICFDFQCLNSIPEEEHDIQMNFAVTGTKILKFAMNVRQSKPSQLC